MTAWNEAARSYEAAIVASPLADPVDLAALHRAAGLAHRGDMELGVAVKHFRAAIDLLGPDADPVVLTELHVWRIRCGIGSQDVLAEARDRGALESLVERIVDEEPELAAEGLVELAQSYWVDWEMAPAAANARRAMELAQQTGSHRAFVRAVTTLSVPQWADYDLHGSLATLEAGIDQARSAHDDSVLVGGALFRAPLVLTWLGRLVEAEQLALEGIGVAERTHYPLEEGLPLAALTQIAVAAAGASPRPSSTRTRPSSCSGSRAITGPPASTSPRSPPGSSPRAGTTRPGTRSTRGPRPATPWNRRRSSSTAAWSRPGNAVRRYRAIGSRAYRFGP